MAKNFSQLRNGMSAKAREVSAAEHCRLVEEMSLHQLRKARELTQTKIAGELHYRARGCFEAGKTDGHVCQYACQLPSGRWCRPGDSRSFSRRKRRQDHPVFRVIMAPTAEAFIVSG